MRAGWTKVPVRMCGRLLLPLLATAPVAAHCQEEGSTNAQAGFVQPLVITGAQPLEFGELAIPNAGNCLYILHPDANRETSGGTCQFLAGDAIPADFTLSCAANSLVQFQIIHTDEAPGGARFSAQAEPMAVDGASAGAAYQMRACDADGVSEIKVGGSIELSPDAPHEFTGPVGSIRLEVAYN